MSLEVFAIYLRKPGNYNSLTIFRLKLQKQLAKGVVVKSLNYGQFFLSRVINFHHEDRSDKILL